MVLPPSGHCSSHRTSGFVIIYKWPLGRLMDYWMHEESSNYWVFCTLAVKSKIPGMFTSRTFEMKGIQFYFVNEYRTLWYKIIFWKARQDFCIKLRQASRPETCYAYSEYDCSGLDKWQEANQLLTAGGW